MAVNLDESDYFKFVIISDRPKPSKNKFSEKPSKDKDNMSTNSSPPPNNEKLDEKKKNSQETNEQTVPEVKVNDTPNNNGDSTKEQTNEEKISGLTIKVPSRSTSPQLVTSPNDITGAKTPERSPVSPSGSFFKKLGNMMKHSADNGTAANTVPNQEEATTSDSKVQMQQEQQIVDNTVANNNITDVATVESPVEEKQKEDEDKKGTPETAAPKQRTSSLNSITNVKLFISRTSSLLVEKIKEEFDNLDRRIYPDMDPDWVPENQDNLSKESVINEREQLLENKDVEITNGTSQKFQPTRNIMADVGEALNERKEKLESIGERTEAVNNKAADFLEMARQISRDQEQKSKSWKFWQ